MVATHCTGCDKLHEITDDSVLITIGNRQYDFCSVKCYATNQILLDWKPEKGRKPQ